MALVSVKVESPNLIKVGALGLTYWFSYGALIAVSHPDMTYILQQPRGGKWSISTKRHLNCLTGMANLRETPLHNYMDCGSFEAKVQELERLAVGTYACLSK